MVTSGEGATACLPLNILQCTGQPSTIKSFPVQSVSSAEFEKPCRALNEQRSHSGNLSMHEFQTGSPGPASVFLWSARQSCLAAIGWNQAGAAPIKRAQQQV